MEDIIFFIVVAISIAASAISNYNKEAKKNAKRVVGKPVSATQASTAASSQQAKTVPTIKKTVKAIKSSTPFQDFRAEGQQAINSKDYLTENEIVDEKEFDYDASLEDNKKNTSYETKNVDDIFDSKNDLKKAIIYSTILERKF